MSAASPLPLVISLAEKARDAIARQAATAAKLVEEARTQLEALRRYRGEYLARSVRQAEHDAAELANFAAFMGRLEAAIAQQERTVEHHRARAEALRGEWTKAAIKVKSLEALAAARARDARVVAGRLERKAEDEHASRIARDSPLRNAF